MKDSEIYRRAAEMVQRARYDDVCWFSCLAIDAAGELYGARREAAEYVRTFSDDGDLQSQFELDEGYRLRSDRDAKKLRVLALCLMSAIAESEGR